MRLINTMPTANPITGEDTIGSTTFGHRPSAVCLTGSWTFQRNTDQWLRALASAAPHRPPMSAWLRELGSPSHHVSRPHRIAESSAASRVVMVTNRVSTSPLPMVAATAVPMLAPMRLKTAAMMIACRAVSTRVETTVAIALAASWKPLTYSKASAASRTSRKSVIAGEAAAAEGIRSS